MILKGRARSRLLLGKTITFLSTLKLNKSSVHRFLMLKINPGLTKSSNGLKSISLLQGLSLRLELIQKFWIGWLRIKSILLQYLSQEALANIESSRQKK